MTDRLVTNFIIAKFVQGDGHPKYDAKWHGPIEDITVLEPQAEWECGCYSDYTRDDQFVMRAKLGTWVKHPIDFSYGTYGNLPEILRDLAEFEENLACPYESE